MIITKMHYFEHHGFSFSAHLKKNAKLTPLSEFIIVVIDSRIVWKLTSFW